MSNIIKIKDIEHLSYLCRLKLSSEEKKRIGKDLKKILDFFSELRNLDLEKEEPFLFEDQVNISREDEVKTCNPEIYLSKAPLKERQFFKVPRILN